MGACLLYRYEDLYWSVPFIGRQSPVKFDLSLRSIWPVSSGSHLPAGVAAGKRGDSWRVGVGCVAARRAQHLAVLAAVPSRGRTTLGASSAPRSAHAPEVERWWRAVPRCGARVLRTRAARLSAATNLVAPGPMCSHREFRPAVRASRPCDGTVARYGRRPCRPTRRRCLPRTPGSAARS
jgi:hypothetical protein